MTLRRGQHKLVCSSCEREYFAWDITRPHYCKECRRRKMFGAGFDFGKPSEGKSDNDVDDS